ncbi:MAG: hypothetical protein AB1749_14795 [Pseudomonadota bacterium]
MNRARKGVAIAGLWLLLSAPATAPGAFADTPAGAQVAGAAQPIVLDRLMMAESGGDDTARNPRSTALGPFQFIESTFLDIVGQYFAAETTAMSRGEILSLRTNRAFARRAAEAFTRENAAHLASEGVPATYPNLRLAYLVGPTAAVRVLKAAGETPLASLLGPAALKANPFMTRLTAAGLIARSARELSLEPATTTALADGPGALPPKPALAKPAIAIKCSLARASCRHWLATQKAKLAAKSKLARR